MRFIGSKANLVSFIENAVKSHCDDQERSFGDVFCGSACVSRHFKKLGYAVTANDNLSFCTTLAKSILLVNEEPSFEALCESGEIPSTSKTTLAPTSYDQVLSCLNGLSGFGGFMYSEYSPSGTATKEHCRKYFTDDNAMRIDAIREKVSEWNKSGLLNEGELSILISDILRATNKVANIAGTYGYFMKDWRDPRVHKRLMLERSIIVPSRHRHFVYQKDANALVGRIDCQILYLDPPYTWRHYGAYYHILETISRWDNPKVEGMSGLRPWEDSKSRYCYRDQATGALSELIDRANSRHIFLSYNSEGLIPHSDIVAILSTKGVPEVYEKPYRRYKSNGGGSAEGRVKERIYYVRNDN